MIIIDGPEQAQHRHDYERGIIPPTLDDLRFDLARLERALKGDLPISHRRMIERGVERLRSLVAGK